MIATRPIRRLRSFLAPGLGTPSWAACGALALLLYSSRSSAQAEAQKPAPNVLLLVDSSGSMELKADGTGFPTCDPTGATPSEKSRWTNLIEVLTGRIENYRCWKQQRKGDGFKNEFRIAGVAPGVDNPPDLDYVNPYHRALSTTCAYGAGTPSPALTPYSWETNYVKTLPVVANAGDPSGYVTNLAGSCTFEQDADGLLDIYERMVRFGLMTFDTVPNAGTGLASPFLPGTSADPTSGVAGTWSYYVGQHTTGYPVNCAAVPEPEQEVGARNAAAPPWEGRMVAFGPYNEADPRARNRRIQDVLLATRPFGATPIAGQLDDARQFLYHDTTRDPLDTSQDFGPYNDANWKASNCRKTILILLTDGEPNLDLRPFCEPEPAGKCPYNEPQKIVEMLYNGEGSLNPGNMGVETYVIGFGLPEVNVNGSPKSCSLIDSECGTSNDPALQACCTLNDIAAAGGKDALGTPRKAYFASNDVELKSVFADILDDVIQVATRTMPVFSSPGGDSASKGYKFFSAFDPQPDPTAPRLWEGILERRRYVCTDGLEAKLEDMTPSDGDDFVANLNSGAGLARRFYTVIADGNHSARSVRPFVDDDDDGLGTDGGDQDVANGPGSLAGIIPPDAMGINATTCTGKTAAQCRDLVVQHLVGITNADNESRCVGASCKLFGAIYHSVPTPVPGRPSELLPDESYQRFAAELTKDSKRPSVLYTSTTDGFLHAFRLSPSPGNATPSTQAVTTKANNELWTFLPPAVLPHLYSQYPDNNLYLLDGVPIIKDVVATRDADKNVTAYERVVVDAEDGAGTWRTVLVQGFGDMSPVAGYFALDITEPDRASPDTQKPTFRWQLTTDDEDKPLFGKSATPLITTVFLNGETDEDPPTEVPVAVLPGGDADDTSGPASITDEDFLMDIDPKQAADYGVVREGRHYPDSTFAARSLTIVRLDTGAVIRTFRANQGPFADEVYTYTDLDAPITGQPKAFPETTGAVADRIYVGDRDGRLWRVDVSSQDPTQWTMKRMFDAFRQGGAAVSQPVVLPPVLSVDDSGGVTIAFATGSQELDNSTNQVISLTDRLNEAGTEFEAHLNWNHALDPGDRVTGSMVLFNSALYYAVSRPPATTGASCDVGSSKVYGVHYIESDDFAAAQAAKRDPEPSSGPGRLPGRTSLELASQPGLVFGVSLEAEPACASAEETIGGNDSFGYGSVKMSKQVNPGKLYLSYSASGNNTGADNRGVLEVREELASPRLPVTFQSWAPVYE